MPTETTINSINDLNPLWPVASDPLSSGDDHIRIIKDAIVKTFAGIDAPVTGTSAELNSLTDGFSDEGSFILVNKPLALPSPLAVTSGGTGGNTAATARSALGAASSAISVVAGAGLSGGGTLAASRTLNVGAGSGISVASNAVSVDTTVARTTTSITAANGLTGGGTLSSNRSISVGAGSGISVSSDAVAVDNTVVRSTRVMTAGNGLTGGGTMASNRTISLGTPSTINQTTGNTVTATSHTHDLPNSAVGALCAELPASAVGALGLCRYTGGGFITYGSTVSGSLLKFTSAGGNTTASTSPAGTWRCLGSVTNTDNESRTSLFQRVS